MRAGGADAVAEPAWDEEVRARALARLSRRAAPRPIAGRLTVLLGLAGLHALVFWCWWQNRFRSTATDVPVMVVRLIDESARPPRLPEPAALSHPVSHPAAAMLRAPPSPVSAAAPVEFTAPPPLFDPNGTLRLPSEARFITPHDRGIARGKELLARGHNIIHCRRSRFDNSLTPAEAAVAAARSAHMAHLVMGNPLDPLNDVGQQQAEDAAGEHAAEKREIEEQACDD